MAPTKGQVPGTKLRRLLDKLRSEHGDNGCWPWPLYRDRDGYGRVNLLGASTRLAYRVVYERLAGPVPDGMQLDHLCRNRACVNPAHLEPVTCRENLLRSPLTFQAHNAAKTHCPQGHPYDEDNTEHTGGGRRCRTCRRVQARAQYRRAAK